MKKNNFVYAYLKRQVKNDNYIITVERLDYLK